MGRLTCQCLNVGIHTKSTTTPLDLKMLHLPAGEQERVFFKGGVAEVQLDLGGISEEQKCLITRSTVGEWVVRTCVNCDSDCYATHISKGINRVLVSRNLLNDTAKQDMLRKSPEFSPLFHIILHDVRKVSNPTLGHPTTSSQDILKKTANELQDQLTRYLDKEKAMMSERIKKFTEDQQTMFTNLQKKAFRDKNLMVGLIVEADEKSLEDSITEAMLETALTPPQTPVTHSYIKDRVKASMPPLSVSYPRSFHGGAPSTKSKTGDTSGRVSSVLPRETAPPRSLMKPRSRSTDADTMFDVDGFNEDCDPFFESDDESSTDDNSLHDEHMMQVMSGRIHGNRPQHCATSVPITMPTWNREAAKLSFDEEDEDDKVPLPEPDNMVASMKALSLSVQDGTEMFGDLPRPRLNTGETQYVAAKINL